MKLPIQTKHKSPGKAAFTFKEVKAVLLYSTDNHKQKH